MVLVTVVGVEAAVYLVATLLGETVELNVANLALAVVPGKGAGIGGLG